MAARQPSAIRIASIRFAERKDSVEAINVAIGNVSLPMHPAMRERLAQMGRPGGDFADGVVRYSQTVGTDEAREAVKNVLTASLPGGKVGAGTPLHIQITDGGSQAMELMILACCGPAGSEERPLLLIDACYTNYLAFAERLGRKVVTVRRALTEEGEFPMPSREELERAFERYRPGAVVVIPFDNPTGALYRKADLLPIAELCVQYNSWLVSDEAYRELHYTGGETPSVWALTDEDVPGLVGRRIGIETASKVWNACGIRIGALVTDNAALHQQCVAENTASLCPSSLGQTVFGSLAGESHERLAEWFAAQRSYYSEMMTTFHQAMLAALPGAIVSQPQASLYSVIDVRSLVDDSFSALDFVLWCANSGTVQLQGRDLTLLVAPMEGFYDAESDSNPGRTQFRVAFVEPPETMALIPQLFSALFKAYLAERYYPSPVG